jgi:hypothetical protein
MAKAMTGPKESSETPKMEASAHTKQFLSKALSSKKSLSKGAKQLKKGK